MRRFDVFCGDTLQPAATNDQAIRLSVQGDDVNINLRIEDISRTMVSNIPDVLLDLLEVAAYVYCADQRLPRGSDKLTDFGRDWRRDMHFTIPLRQPELWESPAVKDALTDTLGFLSDDSYSFSFVRAAKPLAEKELYFAGLLEGTFQPDEVAMFSGGIDSFAGAVEDLEANGKALALVGHHSATKVFSVQKELVDALKEGGLSRQIFYVPVNITNSGANPVDHSQRARSFLFACLGLVIARMFGKEGFTFYENGVVSINIPLAGDVMGARATRTTHPRVLRGFEAIFSTLLDRSITIRAPFQWLTKREVITKIAESKFAHLLARTASCTRPMKWTTQKRHCGTCSQCIDRRFAVLAAGMEFCEPADIYMVDLLTGDRSRDKDVRMALAYVKSVQSLASTPKNRFLAEYPQIASALAWFPDLTADQAKDRIYDLLHRHAADVLSVVADGTRRHLDELVRGELPAASLLAMCFNRTRIDVVPPSGYDQQVKDFMDRLAPPAYEFAVYVEGGRILFRGDFHLDGANFELFAALLDNHRAAKKMAAEVPFIPAPDLAVKLKISEASLRQQVSRLRKLVTDRLAVDLGLVLGTDDFIENKERAGYRLSPKLREVSRADLQDVPIAMSQA